MSDRATSFAGVLAMQPAFRRKQCLEALFAPGFSAWMEVIVLPKALREQLASEVPWMAVKGKRVLEGRNSDVAKALLELEDGSCIESVLMRNARGQWSVCVSTQVGCAMRCTFCATGRLGLKRNLTVDEIVDQYRFWKSHLSAKNDSTRISNIVLMGMGEPLANYENVKAALQTWLQYTDVGPTHITVSTVGVLPRLDQILTDATWPGVRLAISLHSADLEKRKALMPSTSNDFLAHLADWAKHYLEKFGNRRHHLTFEYILINNVNDTKQDLEALAAFVSNAGRVKVNLIPYNTTGMYKTSGKDHIEAFARKLEERGVTVTVRRSMGDDIDAACGQLANKNTAGSR